MLPHLQLENEMRIFVMNVQKIAFDIEKGGGGDWMQYSVQNNFQI